MQNLPWRLPTPAPLAPGGASALTDPTARLYETVNGVLNQSLAVQMGHIPGTEFVTHILTKEALAVCGMLQLYLSAVLSKKEASRITTATGIMQFTPGGGR